MDKLFDISDTSDTPFDFYKPKTEQQKVLELFELADGETLGYPQLQVAYFRKYGVKKTVKQLSGYVTNLKRDKKIVLVSRGKCKLNKSGE